MHKESCNYGEYFHLGQRARVEMALQSGSMFRDGAVVTAVADNQIGLRLSRDRLPEGAQLHPEAPLLVRFGGSDSGYSCRGVVIGERAGEGLRVALVDRVVSDEPREFFRCRTNLPVALFNLTARTAEDETSVGGEPRIVNISGGGMRTETGMEMSVGDKLYATFSLPLPELKAVSVVAEVVHSSVIRRSGSSIVSAGAKFVQICEWDRDAVVRFVCNEEMRRIRVSRKTQNLHTDKTLHTD